jgi:hypothetical protein
VRFESEVLIPNAVDRQVVVAAQWLKFGETMQVLGIAIVLASEEQGGSLAGRLSSSGRVQAGR